MRFDGTLYRAINPVWARQPLSGEGARRFGGRFNPRGTPALYTALSIQTALREANRVGTLQPIVLVSYRASIEPVFDATNEAKLAERGLTAADLADDGWHRRMDENGIAPTQEIARRLIAEGFRAMRVPSFAPGATEIDVNLVLWAWGSDMPAQLILIDDEGRLT